QQRGHLATTRLDGARMLVRFCSALLRFCSAFLKSPKVCSDGVRPRTPLLLLKIWRNLAGCGIRAWYICEEAFLKCRQWKGARPRGGFRLPWARCQADAWDGLAWE